MVIQSEFQKNLVLVVDDEENNRELIGAILQHYGYSYETAANGKEALRKTKELSPDLILLDIMMPQMDGYEVCRRIKEDYLTQSIPIIMVTSLSDRDARLKGLDAGANDFLSSPIDGAELMARTRNLLRAKEYEDMLKSYGERLSTEVTAKTAELAFKNKELEQVL